MIVKTKEKTCRSFLIIVFFTVNIGFGQMIFSNSITENDIVPDINYPYTNGQYHNSNIKVSGIGHGTGVVGNNSGFGSDNRYNLRDWNTENLDPTAYFEFIIEPNTGYEIDFVSFEYRGQASATGPVNFAFRSSLDNYTNNLGTPTIQGTTIDLSLFQNITSAIAFRFYAWGASSGLGTFSINDFTFNGIVSPLPCASTVTWSGNTWINGLPDLTTEVIINANYNTAIHGSFSACKLTINSNSHVTVANSTFVEVINDVIVDGELLVETKGNFVQIDENGTFTVNAGGSSKLIKETPEKAQWYHYTYWSSPVKEQTIQDAFPNTGENRRFWFNAANYLDLHTVGTTNGISDNIDDDGNDWQYVPGNDVMKPGIGYAVTEPRTHIPGSIGTATFIGAFNTGDISTKIYNNPLNMNGTWNLIGNPYPSAIDFIKFQKANSSKIGGAAYFWSQATPPSDMNPGNQALNFSQDDYAVFNAGSGGIQAGINDLMPNGYIASGQSFFVSGLIDNSDITFTNAMRMADDTSNDQFFKNFVSKNNYQQNKLWLNLTSDNGVFNQILIAYVEGATNGDDGPYYDATRLLAKNYTATLYSNIENSMNKFAIQGKDVNSLDAHEIIQLGFATTIDVETLYTLSIAQLQGEFFTNNTVYLKDSALEVVHNLSESDYSFTSDIGEFNDRFVVIFNHPDSTDRMVINTNTLHIIDLDYDQVKFIAPHTLKIKKVSIFDLLGRELYQFKGEESEEIYSLPHLNNTIYIAKVELSDGTLITKKAIKK